MKGEGESLIPFDDSSKGNRGGVELLRIIASSRRRLLGRRDLLLVGAAVLAVVGHDGQRPRSEP